MSNIIPPEEPSLPTNKIKKPDKPKSISYEIQANTLLENLGDVQPLKKQAFFKNFIQNIFTIGLLLYGGYLSIYAKQTEAGMAAVGVGVTVVTSRKQKDDKNEQNLLKENFKLKSHYQQLQEYSETLEDFYETEKRNLKDETNSLIVELAVLSEKLKKGEEIAKLRMTNQALNTEVKYLSEQLKYNQLPTNSNSSDNDDRKSNEEKENDIND